MKNIPVTLYGSLPPGVNNYEKIFPASDSNPKNHSRCRLSQLTLIIWSSFFSKFFAGLYPSFMLCLRPNFLFINVEYSCFILGLYLRITE